MNIARSPEEIRKFFEGVVLDAEEILSWFKLSQQHCEHSTMVSLRTTPSLTVWNMLLFDVTILIKHIYLSFLGFSG